MSPSPAPDNEKSLSPVNSESLKTTSSVSELSHPPPPSLIKGEVLSYTRKTTSISKWGVGRDRRQLSQEGYRALAICATFLAGMQGQVMGFATLTLEGEPIPLASAIFLLGLFADVFGAILSFSTARWFEMLTEDEADFLQRRWDLESGDKQKESDDPAASLNRIDRWICLSLIAGPYVVVVGLVCLTLGLLVYAWTSQPLVVLVLACVLSAGCMAFVMAFVLHHNRMNVLAHFYLKRRSG